MSVSFFQYEKVIAERLSYWGAEVDFYDERPSNSNFSKGIIRFNKKLYQHRIQKYYKRILNETLSKKYDYFLLIKGEATPAYFLEKVKENNPGILMIYYSFDALAEYPKLLNHLSFFDKKFTFEYQDAVRYGLKFRPLFYLDEYRNPAKAKDNNNYDIVFIGSAHTDRYLIGEQVKKHAGKLGLQCFFYYYAMGKIAFNLKKILDHHLKQFDTGKLSFEKLTHKQIINYYENSISVLDINKPFQNGLTIRTFEVLASGRKLITTNSDIKNYPFYNPNNIFIIDREVVELDTVFFKIPFEEMDEDTLRMMSLDSFIECLFFKDQDHYWDSFRNKA